jgi:hypothetical protein
VIEADPPRLPHHHYPSRGSSNGRARGRSSTSRLNLGGAIQQRHRPLLLGATSETPLPTRERPWSLLARSQSASPRRTVIKPPATASATRQSAASDLKREPQVLRSTRQVPRTSRPGMRSLRSPESSVPQVGARGSPRGAPRQPRKKPTRRCRLMQGPVPTPIHRAVVTRGKRLVQAAPHLPPTPHSTHRNRP